jgi:acyl-CoA thioester hydrolase
MPHTITFPVYYEDTDAGGVMYHANHLKFCERARTELLRNLGFGNKALADTSGVVFVVKAIKADYIKPAQLDDVLTVETEVTEIRNASFSLKQSIFKKEHCIFVMDIVLVCMNHTTHKATPIPAEIRTKFEQFMREGNHN